MSSKEIFQYYPENKLAWVSNINSVQIKIKCNQQHEYSSLIAVIHDSYAGENI